MNEKILEIIEEVQRMKLSESFKDTLVQILSEVKEEIEQNQSKLEEKHNLILKLNADVKDAQNVAEEHMLKNVELEKENSELKEKFENAKKSIDANKQIILEQQTRIGKLQAIVADVVNKI